jgi:amino acid adenylation domain-containing protein
VTGPRQTRAQSPLDNAPIDAVPTASAAESIRRFPCSAGQQRFWVLNQLDPGNPSLHVAVRWRLEGEVSTTDIERAFQLIIDRHEVLRTYFAEIDGEPMQIVEPHVAFRVPEIDLSMLPAADAHRESERIAQLEARASFDLQSCPPLMRVTRLRLSPENSILLLTLHHIVSDGWSIGLLAQEMGEICAALQTGGVAQIPELPVSYGEFSAWQQECLDSEAAAIDAEFWKHKLTGMEQFELLPDHPRPAIQTDNGAIVSVLLESSLSQGLAELARRQGCTLFMAACATLLTALHRYTGETDIGIGTQLASRSEVELENLIGLFINTQVLRTDLSGDPSFNTLLDRVSDVVSAAFEHQHLPLEKIIELVKPKRDRSRNALFSINFVLQRSFIKNAAYGRFKLIDMPSVSAGALYDLNFFMVERPEGWRFSCEYNTDLFNRETVLRLLSHIENLLRHAIAQPSLPISQLAMLSEPERQTLLTDWNRTDAEYPRDQTLVQLFQAQVLRTPDVPAVECKGVTLSFRQLDQASNRLARELRERGLGAGRRVGVFLNRSVDLVVSLLAVLKSGSAYVAMDVSIPADRLSYVVENAELAGLITRSTLDDQRERRLVDITPQCLLIDRDAAQIASHSDAPLDEAATPDQLAYILYTSGSTGRPKGVLVPHRALVNLLWAVRQSPGIGTHDVLVSVSSIAFDISGLEVFLPLVSGARLVMATEEQVVDGTELLFLLKRCKASVMFATPITWQFLLAAGWHGEPQLKMMCGGEALPRKLAEALLATGGELWNVYGPTETTIYASVARIEPGNGPVPIGGPLPNVRFYVLDAHRQPVPIGAPGELYIGGDQVALGYAGLPDLTRERFIPDPFRPSEGARLYRSGDIVRWHAQDRMEYLGRTDHQIKLRGFRIELGEIESVLLQHPQIAEAVAIVGEDAAGDKAIWAYAVSRQASSEALIDNLRTRLRHTLPSYMCPATITVLPAMPRSQNGKVDHRALPKPVPIASSDARLNETLNPVEQKLAAIWCSTLSVTQVDKRANFFELGGHSLLAARMLARIEAEFGQRLTLAALFRAPSVQELARLIEQRQERDYDFRQVVKLQPNGSRMPVLAINNTGIYYQLSKHLGPDQPFTSLQLFDPSNPSQQLPGSFEEIAAGYVELIRHVQPKGPYVLLGWCIAGSLAFEIARQLSAAGEEVAQLLLVDTYAPGYLHRMPRWRAALAEYAYRWKLIARDWSRVRRGKQSVLEFLSHRVIVRKLRSLFGHAAPTEAPNSFETRNLAPENYDQWLLTYLKQTMQNYEPKLYPGKITLFRSAEEPTGPFLDFRMGWGAYARDGVDVAIIKGDHFSMFRQPGVAQMAQELSRALGHNPDESRTHPGTSRPSRLALPAGV